MGHIARVPFGLAGVGLVVCAAPEAFANGARTDLPFAQGQDFADLDAYLAHLETLGTIGVTWYRRLPDGTYQEIRLRPPGTSPRTFTRHDLLDLYGFEE